MAREELDSSVCHTVVVARAPASQSSSSHHMYGHTLPMETWGIMVLVTPQPALILTETGK